MKTITLRVEEEEHRAWRIAALQEGKLFGEWVLERMRLAVRGIGKPEKLQTIKVEKPAEVTKPETPVERQTAKPVIKQPGVEPTLTVPVSTGKSAAELKAEADLAAIQARRNSPEELRRLAQANKDQRERYGTK